MTVKAMAHELLQLTLRQLVEIESATRTPILCEVVNGGTTGLSEVADGAELSRRLSALLLWQWKLSNANDSEWLLTTLQQTATDGGGRCGPSCAPMLTEPQHKVDRSVLPKKGEEKKTQHIVTSGKNSDDALTLSSRLRQLELWVESEISWRGGGTPPALGDNKNPCLSPRINK